MIILYFKGAFFKKMKQDKKLFRIILLVYFANVIETIITKSTKHTTLTTTKSATKSTITKTKSTTKSTLTAAKLTTKSTVTTTKSATKSK